MSRGRYRNGSQPKEGFLLHKDFPLMVALPESAGRLIHSDRMQTDLAQDSSLLVQVRSDLGASSILCLSHAGVDRKLAALHKVLQDCDDREPLKEISLYVPADMVPVIIGKRGRQIARFQEQSHASISVEDRPVPHMSERIITIGGPLKCIESAVELIHTAVTDHRCYDRERQTVISVRVREDDLRACRDWLQARPEVRVQSGEVVIQGSVRDCVYMSCLLFEKLDEISPRGDSMLFIRLSHRSSHLPHKLRALRRNFPSNVELTYTVESAEEARLVLKGGLRARLGALREVVEELEEHSRSVSRESQSRSRSRSPCILNILVPQDCVGRLIGKSGCNVQALKEQSGCQINFQPHSLRSLRTATGQEARVCTLSGTAASVARGTRVVLQQVLRLDLAS